MPDLVEVELRLLWLVEQVVAFAGRPRYFLVVSDDPTEYLRVFYQALSLNVPLEPGDSRFVDIKGAQGNEVVEALRLGIEWEPLESVQLFSGFRGTGKSTALRRLRAELKNSHCLVVLCDMQNYLNLTTPIDISDFLIAIAGAFSDGLCEEEFLGRDFAKEGYWVRVLNFFTRTKVEIEGLEIRGNAKAAGEDPVSGSSASVELGGTLKANLKEDPGFRKLLQERMSGHLGRLVADVREFMNDCVKALRKRHGADTKVVLLLDSVEQIRGTSVNADDVFSSVETVFAGHADKLRFDSLHVVYTAPPWLKIRHAGVSGNYNASVLLPCVKVRDRDGNDYEVGLNALEKVVRQRGEWKRLFGGRELLNEVIRASGGYLRDLFRLLRSCLRLANGHTLPLDSRTVGRAIDEVRNSYLPVALDDARWLAQVSQTNDAQLESVQRLADLSRLFDTHMLLCYQNGEEWYGLHPLIRDHVKKLLDREKSKRA